MNQQQITTTIYRYFETYGLRILLALVVLWLGFMLINFLSKILQKQFERRKIDRSLSLFMVNLANWSLKILLLVSIASMIGVETASFVVVIGSIGLALGLALQGSLQNFAGGLLILLTKPYKIGDLVAIQGEKGKVKEIEIFSTILITDDNRTVILPNALVSNGKITNFSRLGNLRLDIFFQIAPTQDFRKVQDILLNVMHKHSGVLEVPEPFVGITKMESHGTEVVAQASVTASSYHEIGFDLYAICRKNLIDAQIDFGGKS